MGTLDVLTFDHIFSAKGQKDPVACLSCLARSWCEQKGYNKQKQGRYSLQTYIRSYNKYIYNAYIMHIPPTKWDVSKFLGPKKSRKKKGWMSSKNFGACPTWTVDPPKTLEFNQNRSRFFHHQGGKLQQLKHAIRRETWDSSFQWDPTSLGRHLEGQMKPWNSSQLVWIAWFLSPPAQDTRIGVIFLVGNPNLNLHLWPLASWEGWQPKIYAMFFSSVLLPFVFLSFSPKTGEFLILALSKKRTTAATNKKALGDWWLRLWKVESFLRLKKPPGGVRW